MRITKDDRIKRLEAELDHMRTACVHNKDGWDKANKTAANAIADRDFALRGNSNLSTQVANLQERLFAAERENERMRGYIERVRESEGVPRGLMTTA